MKKVPPVTAASFYHPPKSAPGRRKGTPVPGRKRDTRSWAEKRSLVKSSQGNGQVKPSRVKTKSSRAESSQVAEKRNPLLSGKEKPVPGRKREKPLLGGRHFHRICRITFSSAAPCKPRRARRGTIPGHHAPGRRRSPARGAGAGVAIGAEHAHRAAGVDRQKTLKTQREISVRP